MFILGGFIACQPKSGSSEVESTPAASTEVAQINSLSAGEFKAKAEQKSGIVLDVRTPEEVSQGKIEGAQVLDFYAPNFADKALDLPKDQEIYIYCSAGVRSEQAAELLVQNGYTKVYHLNGGLGTWINQGFALSH